MAIVEVGILVVTKERAVIDVDALNIFQAANHFLERHLVLFLLGEEIRGREHRFWEGRR
jgi:hypothetical protein